nr:phosphopantetheine-binding protein [Acidobacteriota bacterium]
PLLSPYVAPRTDVEREVAAIWERALGIAGVGVHDNFFELGGDSLVGLQVMHSLRSHFALGDHGFTLFDNPTVATIASFLSDTKDEASTFDLRSSRGERRRQRTQQSRGVS